EKNFGARIAHAPCEVAVHRCQCSLTRSQNTIMPPYARPAAGRAYRSACLHKDFQVAQAHRLEVDLARGRNNHHARLGMYSLAAHDARSDSQILQASPATRTAQYLYP